RADPRVLGRGQRGALPAAVAAQPARAAGARRPPHTRRDGEDRAATGGPGARRAIRGPRPRYGVRAMKILFIPFSVVGGLFAGFLGKKLFEQLWGVIDDE